MMFVFAEQLRRKVDDFSLCLIILEHCCFVDLLRFAVFSLLVALCFILNPVVAGSDYQGWKNR